MTAVTADLFDVCGRECPAGADQPIRLDRDGAWLVQAGRVDVYAVQVHDGQLAGGRRHVCRVSAGAACFGADVRGPDGLTLVAVGSADTSVLAVDGAVLRALARHGTHRVALARRLDEWIATLCAGLVAALPAGARPKQTRALGTAERIAAAAGECLSAQSVCWVGVLRGTARFLSRAEAGLDAGIEAGALVPLGGGAWLEPDAPVSLAVRSTDALLDDGDPWRGLQRLHALALHCASALAAAAAGAERARLAAKAHATRATMTSALAGLASAAAAPGAGVPMRARAPDDVAESGSSEDVLLAATRLVAHASGIAFRAPPRAVAGAVPREPLLTIARASRFRTRVVALRGAWWRLDAGPLLAQRRRGDATAPVALLPGPGTTYVLHDPASREVRPMTPALAAELMPFAHAFYRPFPDAALGMWDVARFGLRGCGRDLAVVALMGIGIGLLGALPPLATGVLFDAIIPSADRTQLLQLAGVLIACALAAAMFQVARGVAMQRVESRMGASVQAAVWDRLLALPMPFYRRYAAGDLAVRAMGIDEIRRTLSGAAVNAVLGAFFSVFNYAVMFRYDPGLAGWATLLIAVALVITVVASYLQLRSQRASARLRARTSGLVLQLLSGVGKLKTTGTEVQAFGQWARVFGEQRARLVQVRVIANGHATFNAAFPLLGSLVIFYVAGARPPEHVLGTGAFLAFIAAFNLCLGAALAASAALVGALAAVPLYEQAKPILTTPPEVDGGKSDPGELSGAVELQHVSFRYRADGPAVLRDLSLRIRPGEFAAFVGPSGSGKSTILRLLLGFEHPEAGTIAYDERDLAGLDIQSVRRQIGVVLQTGRLISGDLFTNIVGSSSATIDGAWEAASMAGLDDDIRSFPMGMHTIVSESGGGLSGGQRQRLLIARAILNRPRLLLFDEATSALDNRTQEIVTRSLDALKATRVVIAHRLSTIRHADRIFVVQSGQIVEQGTYDALMGHGGVFTELARRQLA